MTDDPLPKHEAQPTKDEQMRLFLDRDFESGISHKRKNEDRDDGSVDLGRRQERIIAHLDAQIQSGTNLLAIGSKREKEMDKDELQNGDQEPPSNDKDESSDKVQCPKPLDADSPSAKRQRRHEEGATAMGINEVTDETDVVNNENSGQKLKAARPQHESLKTSTLFIGGLHPRVAKIHLEKLFSKYGTIQRLDLKITSSSNYCFCQMQSIAQAQRAMEELDGRMLLNKRLVVKSSHGQSRHTNQSMQTPDQRSTSNSDGSLQNQQRQIEDKIKKLKRKIDSNSSS
jgi:RNA recognition motif-containing protein